MIDIEAQARKYVAGLAGVQAVFGTRVYAGRSLPAGYLPSSGPAALMGIRGGGQAFHSNLYMTSMQIRVYAETEAKAREAGRDLYDAINDTQSKVFAYVRLEEGTLPTLLNEPGANWPYVLCYYTFQTRNV